MFYGVEITHGPEDWQVLQRMDGASRITVRGRWQLEPGAIRAGVRSAVPVWRLVNEMDQSPVIPWTPCDEQTGGDHLGPDGGNGEWKAVLSLPEGGPYRLETSLDAVSLATGEHWMFRGDIRLHLGVGDVFCIAGQSNAAGYAKGTAYDPPDPRVHLLRNSGRWDMAAHPMNDATGAEDCINAPMGITGTSPFLSFGRRYSDLTGLPVGLIQTAQGGSPLCRWDGERNGDLFRNMMDRIGPGGRIRAVLWYQGCADADADNAPLYGESFARMVVDARRAAGWKIPFFTMQLNRYAAQTDGAAWAQVKEAQRNAARMDGVYLLPTAGLPQSDEIHNSASANVILGEWLAKQVHGALNGGPPFEAPALTEAAFRNGKVCLSFANTSGLVRLRPTLDAEEFILEDAAGRIGISSVSAEGRTIRLTPERKPAGRLFVSYGCRPTGPEGIIADERTFLPVISFYHAEVVL